MRSHSTNGSLSGYSSPTLAEIKTYLSEDASTYNDLINDCKYAVFASIEEITGQNLNDASGLVVTARYDRNERIIELPLLPVTSVTSVTSYAQDDSSTALTDTTNFKSYGQTGVRNGRYWLDMFKEYDELEVVYVSNGSTLPYDIKLGVLAWIKSMFNDNRDFTGDLHTVTPPKETLKHLHKYINYHL